jgi:hypothetical protein
MQCIAVVTRVPDHQRFQAFHPPCNRGDAAMTAGRPTKSRDRKENLARGMLGIALLAAVAWALMNSGSPPDLLGSLWS